MFFQLVGDGVAGAIVGVEEVDMSNRHSLTGAMSMADDPDPFLFEEGEEAVGAILDLTESCVGFDFDKHMVLLVFGIVLQVLSERS